MGVSQHRACAMWNTYEQRLYELEAQGLLHPLTVGQYVYYSTAELTDALGPPNGATPR